MSVMSKFMYINRCPSCGNMAMSIWLKFTAKSLGCIHCNKKLRLRLTPTVALALVVYIAIISAGVIYGVNSKSILFTVGCLLVFLLACFLMPLEVVNNDQSS